MNSEFVVAGRCKLECNDEHKADCKEQLQRHLSPRIEALQALAAAVERYLDNPGCNVPAQQTAKRRLRWALDRAQESLR